MREVTRRAFLLGGGGVVAAGAAGLGVERGVLPGRSRLYASLGLNGDAAPVPDAEGGPKVTGSFASQHQGGREVGWAVAYPPGSPTDAALPVVVALHASTGDHETVFSGGLWIDRFLGLAVEVGVAPFAVASVDGNGGWLPRGAVDSGRTVTDELLPLLADRGLDTRRVGFMGWSAGGLGALVLGARADGVRVVGVTSPALSEGDAAFGVQETYDELPLRVDCGRGDPFYFPVKEFVEGIDPRPAGGFNDGGHTHGYWRRMVPAQLRFIGERLA